MIGLGSDKNISAHSYETYEISKNLKLRGLPAKCFGAKSFPDNAVFTLFGVSSPIYVSTQSNCQLEAMKSPYEP